MTRLCQGTYLSRVKPQHLWVNLSSAGHWKTEELSARRFLRATLLTIILMVLMSGCASLPRSALSEVDQDVAVIEGFSSIRFWGDGPAGEFGLGGSISQPQMRSGRITYLVLSGGGSGGAYGAGVLTGWSALETRPTFDVVSGVSTGALIAPFAFLGSSYVA